VARAQAGDPEALRELYIRHADDVSRYVRRIVREDHEAEDVTQQVFAKLMTVLPAYRECEDVPFSAWLRRVAHNVAVDDLRRRRATPSEDVPGAAASPADDTGDRCRSCLREALGGLPPDQRDVLVLRHLVGLLPQEIAERLGRSVGSVHGLHHRGRLAARVALADLGAAPATLARAGGARP
jgi:RNA polymerase sigma-70 factor (ECF subfamily)